MAVECEDELFVVGFDMEWPFNFVEGPGKTAVIQISSSLRECIILHVSALKTIPKSLTEFLKHPKVRLAGVNIKKCVIWEVFEFLFNFLIWQRYSKIGQRFQRCRSGRNIGKLR